MKLTLLRTDYQTIYTVNIDWIYYVDWPSNWLYYELTIEWIQLYTYSTSYVDWALSWLYCVLTIELILLYKLTKFMI